MKILIIIIVVLGIMVLSGSLVVSDSFSIKNIFKDAVAWAPLSNLSEKCYVMDNSMGGSITLSNCTKWQGYKNLQAVKGVVFE